MSGFISSSPFHSPNSIPSSRYCSPKFGAILTPATTPASNYSQSVHRLRNPRVPLRSSRRGLCRDAFGSSIGPPSLRQSMDSSRLRRGSSSSVSLLHGFQPSSSFFFSPPCTAPLSLLTGPRRRDPHPCAPALPLPAVRRWRPALAAEWLGRGSLRRRRHVPLQAWPGGPYAHGAAARPRPPRRRPSSSPRAAPAPSPWP
jgi:hypothetical protein